MTILRDGAFGRSPAHVNSKLVSDSNASSRLGLASAVWYIADACDMAIDTPSRQGRKAKALYWKGQLAKCRLQLIPVAIMLPLHQMMQPATCKGRKALAGLAFHPIPVKG